MLWRNDTGTTQLVYDTMWNQFYVKPHGVIDDSRLDQSKLVGVLTPVKSKLLVGVVTSKVCHTKLLRLLRCSNRVDFIEIPTFNERFPGRLIRDKYTTALGLDTIIILGDSPYNAAIERLCRSKRIPLYFLVSSLLQHLHIKNPPGDAVITYGEYSKQEFKKLTGKPVYVANYLQYGLSKKLSKAQRAANNTILVVDELSTSKSITAVKDIYTATKEWAVNTVFHYGLNSPRLSSIKNGRVHFEEASIVVSTPTFSMLRAALVGLPVVKVDYDNYDFPDLRFNIKERSHIVTTLRKALDAKREDLRQQTTIVNKLCTTSRTDLLGKVLKHA